MYPGITSFSQYLRLQGHERVDTTLRYTRLYDCTVAHDYHQAMERVEES